MAPPTPTDPRDEPPQQAPARPPGRRTAVTPVAGVATPLALLAAILGLTAACSGDSDDPGDDGAPTSSATATASGSAAPADPALTARVGQVAGRLPSTDRQAAAQAVGDVVDGYLEAAYVGGDWPRSDAAGSFPGFTKGARATAIQRAGLLSSAEVGDQIESVTVDRKVARVDLVAAGGTAVGATARVRLLFTTTGDYAHQVRIIGRLFLTPVDGSWKVFGYDVRKAQL